MNIALILSGGTGTRLGGDIPKQYIEVEGRPMIAYALDVFEQNGQIDRIQVVADGRWHGMVRACAGNKLAGFSAPGENRQLSILNGLKDILGYAAPTDNVIIHDAARPMVKQDTITRIIEKLKTHEAVTPVLPVKDTVYICENGRFTGTAKRESLAAGQAPEGFKAGRYYEAVKSLLPDDIMRITGSLEAALMAGMDAAAVEGDEGNFKVTTEDDLLRFRQVMKGKI